MSEPKRLALTAVVNFQSVHSSRCLNSFERECFMLLWKHKRHRTHLKAVSEQPSHAGFFPLFWNLHVSFFESFLVALQTVFCSYKDKIEFIQQGLKNQSLKPQRCHTHLSTSPHCTFEQSSNWGQTSWAVTMCFIAKETHHMYVYPFFLLWFPQSRRGRQVFSPPSHPPQPNLT